MTFAGLILRNLRYHWRGNLAVFLGVALAAAILTGALLVGDSLRGSLRALTLEQLGWVEQTLTPGRFFREKLAESIPAKRCAPVILLQGSAMRLGEAEGGPVQVFGVDSVFWPDATADDKRFWQSRDAVVVLNAESARMLNVEVGGKLWINVQKSDAIPRETLLGKRKADDVVEPISVTVAKILPNASLGGFTLRPSPTPSRNAFVPLRFLQERLKLEGRVNGIFLAGGNEAQSAVDNHLALADWGLSLRTPDSRAEDLVRLLDPRNEDGKLRKLKWKDRIPEALAKAADDQGTLTTKAIAAYYRRERRYLSLQSEQLYIADHVADAVEQAAGQTSRTGIPSRDRYGHAPL